MFGLPILLYLTYLNISYSLSDTLDNYLIPAVSHANERIENAITTPSGVGGTNVASDSNIAGNNEAALSTGVGGTPDDWCPNYQYSWLRDQALVMTTVMNKYATALPLSEESKKYEEILQAYASNANAVYEINDNPLQFTDDGRPWSHAEAKYELYGHMYTGGWCSPQNDGPALRAVVLMRFAERYAELHPLDTTYIRENLYSNSTDVGVKNPIKRDLEFLYQKPQLVATDPDRYTGYWDSDNCEPWEEVFGKHFYNRLMARRAMVRGADFATAQGDPEAGANYASIVSEISNAVDTHWNADLKTIMPTNNDERYDDVQTVFASLHSYAEDDGFYQPSESKVLANAYYTMNSFADYFNINKIGYDTAAPLTLGLAIGRYTGDVYNGLCDYDDSVCPAPCSGQPWFLATNALGELIYKAISQWSKAGSVTIDSTSKSFFDFFNVKYAEGSYSAGSDEYKSILTVMLHAADSFIERTQYHTNSDYRLDEQYNSNTGAMMSAGDLVWSYASLVTANDARDALDPKSLVANLNADTSTVLQEFLISDYDVPEDSSKPVFRIVGNTNSLGNGDACGGDYASRTPVVRRCSKLSTDETNCDYTIVLAVPKDTEIQWQMVRTDTACTAFEYSSAGNTTIAATNNGVSISAASWTK